MNIEQRIRALELQADATLNTTDIITVVITPDTIELTSDVFGRETHPRGGMTIQDIQDELYCRFSDSEDVHFVFITDRDYENRQN